MRTALPQTLVRSLFVVVDAETVKEFLLRLPVRRRRMSDCLLEGAVHPFVAAVLLRLPRLDAFRQNAQSNPPRKQARQAARARAGEGSAVVGADATGQADLPA